MIVIPPLWIRLLLPPIVFTDSIPRFISSTLSPSFPATQTAAKALYTLCSPAIGKEAKLAKTEQGEKYLAEKEVYATDVEPVGLDGTKAVIHIGAESFAVTIPIAGEHNVYNALAAVCVAGKLGLSGMPLPEPCHRFLHKAVILPSVHLLF